VIHTIVVTGLMGSGKTTIGRRLAVALGWAWRDSDLEIEAATGRTVREIRDTDGVGSMHAREAAQLVHAIRASHGPGGATVVSAAASVVEDPACRAAMAAPDVKVVWLRAAPTLLATRFDSDDEHRPAYGPEPALFLAQQAMHREPLARHLGATIIDVDRMGPDEVVARVVVALHLAPERP
jgi:shikimate kinase